MSHAQPLPGSSETRRIRHHFTVDVEEYFQVAALAPYVRRTDWDTITSRVERSTRLLLELLAEAGSTGTFFTLGWIAQRHRQLVLDIAAAGHEIASHGWGHERVTDLTPDEFRTSVRDSKHILEDITGTPVFGYRAPSFSIIRGGEWALDTLLEEGYRYDSSLFPVRRSGYGFAGGQRDPHELRRSSGVLLEVPPATLQVGRSVLPAGGGAYLRLLPRPLIIKAFESAERRGVPATFYTHPWELDPDQPRVDVPAHTRVRHYGGLTRTTPRIRDLLSRFEFQAIATTLGLGTPTGAGLNGREATRIG